MPKMTSYEPGTPCWVDLASPDVEVAKLKARINQLNLDKELAAGKSNNNNDLFNTDNYHNQTTNLTPQEVTVPWHKAYEEGFDLMVDSIAKVADLAREVVVVLIQGNHDRTKSFYLAHALEVFFKSNKNIRFLRENSNTKFVMLGDTFIGYHHGNHVKIDGLPCQRLMELIAYFYPPYLITSIIISPADNK